MKKFCNSMMPVFLCSLFFFSYIALIESHKSYKAKLKKGRVRLGLIK